MAQTAFQVRGQSPPPVPQRSVLPSGGLNFSSTDQFNGSVAQGTVSGTPLKLSLQDAIDRGLKTNLGLLVRGSANSAARAERLGTLSALLPNVTASFAENETQISLAVYGLRFPGIPSVVGPFSYSDLRLSPMRRYSTGPDSRTSGRPAENARAAQLTLDDGRDLVVEGGGLRLYCNPGRLPDASK